MTAPFPSVAASQGARGSVAPRVPSLLHLAAERLRPAERLALGVPLEDPAALKAFVASPRCDFLFTTTRSSGSRGRPATPARVLAVIVAVGHASAGRPAAKARQTARDLLGVKAFAIREAPKRLEKALRLADPEAGFDEWAKRYRLLVEEAARVVEDLLDLRQEAAAVRPEERRAAV